MKTQVAYGNSSGMQFLSSKIWTYFSVQNEYLLCALKLSRLVEGFGGTEI